QPDGTYTFSVSQRDAAGNVSDPATSDYALDRGVPAPPTITAGPGTTGNDSNPEWSFTGEAGAAFECELSSGASVISAFAACSSPHSYDLSAQPDGTYTFSVRQRDGAGNTSTSATSDYALDRGVPAAPSITAGPGPTGSDANPAWSFTGEPGASFQCKLTRGSTVIFGLAPCSSPATYDLSAEGDGTYTFSVRQIDAAGNMSAPATSDYALDRGVPAAPSITAGPGPTGNDANPAWSFTGEPGAAFECQLSSGATVISAFAACTSPHSYDLSAQSDGTYSFSVRQRDSAGNVSAPATSDYALDQSIPSAPSITSGPGTTGNDANPGWSFNGEAGATFECQLSSGATVISAFGSCSSPKSYDLSSRPDGTYTFSVRQRDTAGNTSPSATSDYTLDRSVPAAPTVTAGPGPKGNDANPGWSFTGEAGAAFECQLSSGATVISAFASCSSPKTYDLSSQPDGTYTFSVRQRDPAGNTSTSATSDYTLDRGVPAAPSITAGPGPTGSNANPAWSFTGEPGAAFECQLSSGPTVIAAFASCSSPKTYDLSAQADGTYTFSVRQRDPAGNTSTSATIDYILDRSVPAAPTITARPGPTSNDTNPAWSFTGEPGAAFECQLSSGATVISGFAACNSPRAYDLSTQADGTYTFSVRQRDAAGNIGPAAQSDYILDRSVPLAPVVTGPSPNPGNDADPTWFVTGEPDATFECQLSSGATVVSAFAACTSPKTYDLSAQPDATYTFSARQTDAAGNTGPSASADYVLDRSAPNPPTLVSGPGAGGSDPTPTWVFSGEAGATFTCELRMGSEVVSPATSCTSPVSYDLSGRPDGTYTLVLVQRDAAGNTSTPTTTDYTLDRSSPPPPPGQPAAGGGDTAPAPQAVPGARSGPTARTTSPVLGPLDGSATTGTAARSSDVAASPPAAVASPQTQTQPPRTPRRPSDQPPDSGTTALEILAEVAGKTAFPIILVLIVVMFLAIQDRIDRNDPKLAHAPVRSEPLDFIDPSSLPIRG
ncbi:MAG TPA: Ig-like domain-containing protein, partial [Acidimicrobiales bacterium]|nr:Ig-like domain-containing protein [Acidimicrobiales bacterium]